MASTSERCVQPRRFMMLHSADPLCQPPFLQDKAGYDGFTWRLHFILQRDTAEMDAFESYMKWQEMKRMCGNQEFDFGTEKAQMEYFSKHGTSIVGAVVEGAEDNLLYVHLSRAMTLDMLAVDLTGYACPPAAPPAMPSWMPKTNQA